MKFRRLVVSGVHSALLLILLSQTTSCSGNGRNSDVLDGANTECAEIVVEMRAEIRGLYERVDALAAGDARLLRTVQFTTQSDPFRDASPCFGDPLHARDVPSALSSMLSAALASLRADFDRAGRLSEYTALEDARVQGQLEEKIDRIRTLAQRVAATE